MPLLSMRAQDQENRLGMLLIIDKTWLHGLSIYIISSSYGLPYFPSGGRGMVNSGIVGLFQRRNVLVHIIRCSPHNQ